MGRKKQQAPPQGAPPQFGPPPGPPQGWPPQGGPPQDAPTQTFGQPPPGTAPPTVVAPPPRPPGPAFPPAPRPGDHPGGRHRSSSRVLNWSLVATLTAILLAAVAIVLWRNGALPSAAGAAASESTAAEDSSAGTTDSADATDAAGGSGGTDGSGSESGDAGDAGSFSLPPLPTDPGTGDGDGSTGTEPDPGTIGADGDLGLAVPMAQPACDGSFAVILASVTDPAQYASGVEAWLAQYPGSSYMLTEGSCSSLRQATPEGNQIYAVFAGPFPDQGQACSVRAKYGDGAYVKVLDDVTPPEQIASC
jgi:serine/threonine-protein kinase